MEPKEEILRRIREKSFIVGVIGLGYVGLPLILEFDKRGFRTIGFDIDPQKIQDLKSGKSYLKHVGTDSIEQLSKSGRFDATTDMSRANEADALILCVPTPLTSHREPDMSYITGTLTSILPHLKKGQLISLESTTYPGTTKEIIIPELERRGLKPGEDIFVAFSPEREDPGNKHFNISTTPKVIGADDNTSREIADTLYKSIIEKTVVVSSTSTAEAVKLTENIFRCVNIALVNELKIIYSKMGIDIWEVIEGAKSKPFGFMPFYPGPGLGGHCIPIDPFYLTWKAKEYDANTRFIELAGEINTSMPYYVVQRTQDELNKRGKSIFNAKILIMGLAYKKDIDDQRESPSLCLIDLLQKKGAKVDFYDNLIPEVRPTRKYPNISGKKSIDPNQTPINQFDAVIISTDHSNINYESLASRANLIIDTRNACKNIKSDNVEKA